MPDAYDQTGQTYADRRRPDPRLAARIGAALGDARSVVNVGAGTGSYEPTDRDVVAVDPSRVMLAQRPRDAAPAVRARAESLPFADKAFDAALAVLTVHHWVDQRRGLTEMARVARGRVAILTWDPASSGLWIVEDYFPEILAVDRRRFQTLDSLADVLGPIDVWPVPIPHDCVDGFLGAFWRRPAAYLDPGVREGISSFFRVADTAPQLARLRDDLSSGEWHRRHGALLERDDLDIGYRLVIASR